MPPKAHAPRISVSKNRVLATEPSCNLKHTAAHKPVTVAERFLHQAVTPDYLLQGPGNQGSPAACKLFLRGANDVFNLFPGLLLFGI